MSDQKDKTSEIKIFFDKNEIFAKLKKCGLKRQHVYKVVKILRKGRPPYRRIENQRTRSARTPTKIKLGYAKKSNFSIQSGTAAKHLAAINSTLDLQKVGLQC